MTYPLLEHLLVLLKAHALAPALVAALEAQLALTVPDKGHDKVDQPPRALALPQRDREGRAQPDEDGCSGDEGRVRELRERRERQEHVGCRLKEGRIEKVG